MMRRSPYGRVAELLDVAERGVDGENGLLGQERHGCSTPIGDDT